MVGHDTRCQGELQSTWSCNKCSTLDSEQFLEPARKLEARTLTRALSLNTGLFFFPFFTHIYFPASGQAVVTGVVPSPPGFCLQFLTRIGFSNLTVRRFFIECC